MSVVVVAVIVVLVIVVVIVVVVVIIIIVVFFFYRSRCVAIIVLFTLVGICSKECLGWGIWGGMYRVWHMGRGIRG